MYVYVRIYIYWALPKPATVDRCFTHSYRSYGDLATPYVYIYIDYIYIYCYVIWHNLGYMIYIYRYTGSTACFRGFYSFTTTSCGLEFRTGPGGLVSGHARNLERLLEQVWGSQGGWGKMHWTWRFARFALLDFCLLRKFSTKANCDLKSLLERKVGDEWNESFNLILMGNREHV